ncbi:Aconitate hydratase A [Dissostichus eleginoides]|uniref:Aconitate hydratase A n=1 Tax=Dissostichus eleginoides TaxID=100907 RepID=A0AAD9F780_DISEL|nr:Aconitate hydratase A [Dissostichus eleginoides]
MQTTFALRHQENPWWSRTFLEKWPALRWNHRQKAAGTGKEVQDVHMKRNAALEALPLYLREEDPQLFKSWSAEEVDRPDITNTPVAIVSVVTEGTPSQVDLSPARTAILVEGGFVISNIPRMADSFALLFGLMYVLHLDYPKNLINTFTFIQKVLMGLDDGKPLKPCPLNLKNYLLLRE